MFLGALRLGIIPVPINFRLGVDTLQSIVRDARCRAIIGSPQHTATCCEVADKLGMDIRLSTDDARPDLYGSGYINGTILGIPKGGNEYFIQITTDSVVWGGLSGATPAEAVSWGKVNPGVLPDTVVAYCDSTIAFPLFCEYAVGSPNGRRPRKELVHKRADLVASLTRQAKAALEERKAHV